MPTYGPELPDESSRLPTEEQATLEGHTGPVLAVRWNASGQYCLSCGKDRTFRLWNPAKGLLIKTYTGHAHEVRDVAACADNSKVASVGGDKLVFLWDVGTGRSLRRFRGHESAVNAVLFAAGDSVVVSAGYDQAVRVWDVRSNSIDATQSMAPFRDSVTCLAMDGATVVAGSVDGTLRAFDIRMGKATADEVGAPVTCVRLTRDAKCAAVATLGGCVRLLDRESGALLADFRGHKNESAKVECALTASDAFVVSGSEDGRLHFWDLVEGGAPVASVQAHARGRTVCGVEPHRSEETLLTCATDGTIKLWRPPSYG